MAVALQKSSIFHAKEEKDPHKWHKIGAKLQPFGWLRGGKSGIICSSLSRSRAAQHALCKNMSFFCAQEKWQKPLFEERNDARSFSFTLFKAERFLWMAIKNRYLYFSSLILYLFGRIEEFHINWSSIFSVSIMDAWGQLAKGEEPKMESSEASNFSLLAAALLLLVVKSNICRRTKAGRSKRRLRPSKRRISSRKRLSKADAHSMLYCSRGRCTEKLRRAFKSSQTSLIFKLWKWSQANQKCLFLKAENYENDCNAVSWLVTDFLEVFILIRSIRNHHDLPGTLQV